MGLFCFSLDFYLEMKTRCTTAMPKHAWHAAIRYEFVQGERRQGSQGGISPPMTSVGPRAKVGLSLDLGPRPGPKVPGQKKDHATKNPQLRFESVEVVSWNLRHTYPSPCFSVVQAANNGVRSRSVAGWGRGQLRGALGLSKKPFITGRNRDEAVARSKWIFPVVRVT